MSGVLLDVNVLVALMRPDRTRKPNQARSCGKP